MDSDASGAANELTNFEVPPTLIRKERSLKEFLNMMDESAPIVCFFFFFFLFLCGSFWP